MKTFSFVLCLLSSVIQFAVAQEEVMTLQVSPDANGMAGIASSLPSEEATATISNPAQLGLFSLNGILNASTYVAKSPAEEYTSWTLGSPTLTVSAVNVGLDIGRFIDLPLRLSVGGGYSRTFLDLGAIPITTEENPDGTGASVSWNDVQENYAIGIGLEWFVKLGLGYNFKRVVTEEPSFDSTGAQIVSRVNAHDYGIMVQIPVVNIASRLRNEPIMLSPKIQPVVDVNIGYARRNVGDYIFNPGYPLEFSYTPLPRTATLGLNCEMGLRTSIDNKDWNLFSFIWAREAEDQLLLNLPLIAPTGSSGVEFQYKSGLGDIEPIDNLIFGRTYGKVSLRKGWQVQIADFLFIRGGKDEEIGYSCSTFGTSLQLSGLIKTLAAFNIVDVNSGLLAFLLDHIDLQYHYSEYTNSVNTAMDGTTFKAINLVIR